ncbi:MAG TPA: hypothetical protein VE553_03060 [Candidatus Binatia bacterium]|nr:hypothetical protein [Candidatus Binatia bacterium]
MSATEKDNASQAPNEGDDYLAPLGASSHGRLVFIDGVDGLTVRAGAAQDALLQARFTRRPLQIWAQNGIVTVHSRHLPLIDHLLSRRPSPPDFCLNSSIPWEFEFHGGVSQLNGDLSQILLRSLDILSGASRIRLNLSAPSQTTFIHIAGGISGGVLHLPPQTAVRLQISGGASRLAFAGQQFGAIGGETSLQSPDFDSAKSRYDICVSGGVSHLKIDRNL